MSDSIEKVLRVGANTIVHLVGEIDLNRSPAFHEAMIELCDQRPERMVVNLSDVDYIDSSGIATLVDVHTRLKRDGAKMILVAPSARVSSVLEITRLDAFFAMAQTEQEAMNA